MTEVVEVLWQVLFEAEAFLFWLTAGYNKLHEWTDKITTADEQWKQHQKEQVTHLKWNIGVQVAERIDLSAEHAERRRLKEHVNLQTE